MFGRPKRLSLAHKRLAVRVAKDAFKQSGGNKVEYERLVKADQRTVGVDPALIALFIQVAMAVFQYFMNRQVSGLPVMVENEDEIYLGSIRFEA